MIDTVDTNDNLPRESNVSNFDALLMSTESNRFVDQMRSLTEATKTIDSKFGTPEIVGAENLSATADDRLDQDKSGGVSPPPPALIDSPAKSLTGGETKAAGDHNEPVSESDGTQLKRETPKKEFTNSPDGKALTPTANVDEIKDFMKREKQDKIDYSKFFDKDSPVLWIADSDHSRYGDKDEVAARAKELKAAGVTHFGMEMVPESLNDTMDKYSSGDKAARENVRDYLKSHWNKKGIEGDELGIPDKLMGVLDSMIREGIKPVGIDIHKHDSGKMEERNENWARKAADIIKDNPGSRVVMFGGSAHLGYGHRQQSANEILKDKYNLNSQVVQYAGGMKPSTSSLPDTGQQKVTKAAAESGLAGSRFMLDVNKSFKRVSDKIIHVPQTQEPIW